MYPLRLDVYMRKMSHFSTKVIKEIFLYFDRSRKEYSITLRIFVKYLVFPLKIYIYNIFVTF